MDIRNRSCGCRYISMNGARSWFQVVACPDHQLEFRPLDVVPGD